MSLSKHNTPNIMVFFIRTLYFKTQVRKDARAFIYLYFKNTTQENLEPYLLLLPYQNTTLLPPLFQSVIKEYMFLKTQQSKAACHYITIITKAREPLSAKVWENSRANLLNQNTTKTRKGKPTNKL